MKRYDRSVLEHLMSEVEQQVEIEKADGDDYGRQRATWLLELMRFLDRRLDELYRAAGADTFADGPESQ